MTEIFSCCLVQLHNSSQCGQLGVLQFFSIISLLPNLTKMKLYYQLLFVALCSSVSTALTGRQEVEIKSIVSSLFEKSYDSQYSPPPNDADNSTSSSRPTVVYLSVENFRPLGFLNLTKELLFAADIVAEYVDKRLSYEVREGIKYVDVQAYGGYSVWSPSLMFPHAPVSNAATPDILLDDDSKYIPKVLVGPQGQIYRKFGIYRQVRAADHHSYQLLAGDKHDSFNFTLEIAEEKNSVQNVEIRWKNPTNPIQFANARVTLPDGGKTKVGKLTIVSSGNNDNDLSCSRKENLGVFGEEEFSCVQTSFALNELLFQ